MKKLFTAFTIALLALSVHAQGTEGFVPASVEDLTSEWTIAENGTNAVTLTFVTPTTMIDNEFNTADIPADVALSKVVVYRVNQETFEYEEAVTLADPEKGTSYTLVDNNAEQGLPFGNYEHAVVVFMGDAESWQSSAYTLVGEIPADLTEEEFTVAQDPADEYKLTLTVTLPTLNSMGDPLTMPITKVILGEMTPMGYEPMPIYTEEAAEVLVPGSTFEYVIEHADDGMHTYTAQVFTEAGGNWPVSQQLFIGKDQPGTVENITVEVTAEGNIISWEAPVIGLNGGDQGDLSQLTYTVTRGTDLYDATAVIVADGISELTCTDVLELTEETKFVYIITAHSPYGDGYPTASEELVLGPAATLPFAENFDVVADEYGNTTFEHSTWSRTTTFYYCAWQLGQEAYIIDQSVKPHNGNGLLYAYYDSWGEKDQEDAITSGHIDFSGLDNPGLSFWLYDINQGGSGVTLKVQVSIDGENYETLYELNMGNAEVADWNHVVVDLASIANATSVQVRFLTEAKGANCIPVAIDALLISDLESVGISAVAADKAQSEVRFNLQGQRINAQKGLMIEGGKLMFVK